MMVVPWFKCDSIEKVWLIMLALFVQFSMPIVLRFFAF